MKSIGRDAYNPWHVSDTVWNVTCDLRPCVTKANDQIIRLPCVSGMGEALVHLQHTCNIWEIVMTRSESLFLDRLGITYADHDTADLEYLKDVHWETWLLYHETYGHNRECR